ncbi:MAG: hypothetical protein POG74_05560 [Acidocella sp.]|nr:hypothetical protein [Acidocella sp.]
MASLLLAVKVPLLHSKIAAYMSRRLGWFAPLTQRLKFSTKRLDTASQVSNLNSKILAQVRQSSLSEYQSAFNISELMRHRLEKKIGYNKIGNLNLARQNGRLSLVVHHKRGRTIEMSSSFAKTATAHKVTNEIVGAKVRSVQMNSVPRQAQVISVAPGFLDQRESGQSVGGGPAQQVLIEHAYASQRISKDNCGSGPPTKVDVTTLVREFLDHQARLPPSGATMFDPRLTPAWPGLKMPY